MASVAREFSEFLEAHEKDIFSFCMYLAMSKDDAEELYQDTILAAVESMDKIDKARNPKAFVFSLAAGKWKNMRRKALRRGAVSSSVDVAELREIPGNDDIEAAALSSLLRKEISEALRRLDDKFRIPIILCYFDEYSIDEIGEICKIPSGTVKSRLHKGRIILRQELEKGGHSGI